MFGTLATNHSVLLYHSIGQIGDDPEKLSIDPTDFEHQMDYLYDANYEVIPLQKLLELKPSRRKRVAITFDGGYRDSLVIAKEILAFYKFKASLFIPTAPSFENKSTGHYTDAWGILGSAELLLASMNFDIFPAGHTGMPLPSLDKESCRTELKTCAKLLDEFSPNSHLCLALPHGKYTKEVIDIARACGFSHIFSNTDTPSIAETDVIHRIPITGNDAFASFVSKLHRLPSWIVNRMKKRIEHGLDQMQ